MSRKPDHNFLWRRINDNKIILPNQRLPYQRLPYQRLPDHINSLHDQRLSVNMIPEHIHPEQNKPEYMFEDNSSPDYNISNLEILDIK